MMPPARAPETALASSTLPFPPLPPVKIGTDGMWCVAATAAGGGSDNIACLGAAGFGGRDPDVSRFFATMGARLRALAQGKQ